MPVCKHPLCSSTSERIRKVDWVLFPVFAKLSTWMVARGTSADPSSFTQKKQPEQFQLCLRSGYELGKEVPQGSSCTWRHISFKLFSYYFWIETASAHSRGAMIFLSLGQLGLESELGVSKIISRLMQKIFTLSISHCATAIFQSWVTAISVFITQIIHTTVKVTCWNVTDTLLETPTKNMVPWRSKISDISHALCITAWCHAQFFYTVCSLSH